MKDHAAMFATMDTNNNGVLDANELGPAASKTMDGKCGAKR